MKITWKYIIKRLPSNATLSNLFKTYFQCFVPGGKALSVEEMRKQHCDKMMKLSKELKNSIIT